MKKALSITAMLILIPVLFGVSVNLSVASPGKKILVDNTKFNRGPYPDSSDADVKVLMDDVETYLGGFGYTIDYLDTGPVTTTALSGYDVFWIAAPWSAYTANEISAIVSFVSTGHGLFLVGEWGGYWLGGTGKTYLNAISTTFGITFKPNDMGDPTNNQASYDLWITIHVLDPTHPVTSGKASLQIYAGCSLEVTSPAVAIAWGDGDTYVAGTYTDPGGPVGSGEGAVLGDPTVAPAVFAAASTYGSGRVVAFTEPNAFDKYDYDGNTITSFYEADNELFVLQAMDWLGPRLQAPPPPVGGYSYSMEGHMTAKPLTTYLALIAILTIGFTAIKSKTQRRTKHS